MDVKAFTYADPNDPLWKRLAINAIEVATGRNRIRRVYEAGQKQGWRGGGFFSQALESLKIDLDYDAARLAALPRVGPLIVVSNHPFGVLDGVALCALLERVRPDYRVLANAVLLRAPEMQATMLPIDFSGDAGANRANAASRTAAIAFLRNGGCVAIFPAGAIATSPDFFGRKPAVDLPWTPFLARLIEAAEAPIVPVFFRGQNSRLFQMVSHISMTGRLALFFHEVNRRIGARIHIEMGDLIDANTLARGGDRRALVQQIRERTLALGA